VNRAYYSSGRSLLVGWRDSTRDGHRLMIMVCGDQ
jgi:hypothetical protein